MKTASVVGFYGKLPCRGDFLHRRVPQEFVDVWDAWVRDSLSESRRQLQDRWLGAYLTSPVWRFALTEGLCGRDAYAGVILPSVDRVGRYFPLTIVARWEAEVSPLETACNQERWFESAEALALSALDAPSLDVDDFDEGVAQLAEQLDVGADDSSGLAESRRDPSRQDSARQDSRQDARQDSRQDSGRVDRPAHWYLPLTSLRGLRSALGGMAMRELERQLHPLSIWWTDGSNEVEPGLLCVNGLPEPSGFAAMLSGERAESGWTE